MCLKWQRNAEGETTKSDSVIGGAVWAPQTSLITSVWYEDLGMESVNKRNKTRVENTWALHPRTLI